MDHEPSKLAVVPSANLSTATSSPRPPSTPNSKLRRLSSICSTRDLYAVEKRPTFGQWVKITWLDLLTICIAGALAFPAYYLAPPLGNRVFPLDVPTSTTSYSTSVIPPNFAYPARPQMVSNWLIAIVAIAFPTSIILLMQLRIRSFWDLNNALLGFTYAIFTSAVFQGATKAFVGGLRPNFYDVCRPNIEHARNGGDKTGLNGIGFRKDMWSKDVCTATNAGQLRNAMQAFPSGHSTTMVAAMLYLCLYLNAKLKVFANYHAPLWKLIALVVPLLGAVLLCGTLIIDNTHSWYDVAGGATIGAFMALAAFRMVYASIFDWRVNHIPLHRSMPFDDGRQRPELVMTSRAGWRSPVREHDAAASAQPNAGSDEFGNGNGAGGSGTSSRAAVM